MGGIRRRVLLVVLAAVIVLTGTAIATRWAQRPVPVVVDPACPPLLKHTSSATEDFGDTVTWGGQTYWSTRELTADAGEQIGVVTCSVSTDLAGPGWRVATGPWPDGAATVLPRGTTLHTPRTARPGGALVARTADGDRLYCLEVDPAGPPAC